jgi:uncharacterized membrane protein
MASKHRLRAFFSRQHETGYFAPRTWEFWRTLIVCLCVFSMVGHWLEIPYCLFMDHLFGIVPDEYAVWNEPLYMPYWVYGIGAVVMTLVVEPLKELLITRTNKLRTAFLLSFILMVLLAMFLEWGIGVLINQPDASGVYPFWDNSQLPLNIGGQAWLVNDVVIGAVAMLYVWVLYPLLCNFFAARSPRAAHAWFVGIVVAFLTCCFFAYVPPIFNAWRMGLIF